LAPAWQEIIGRNDRPEIGAYFFCYVYDRYAGNRKDRLSRFFLNRDYLNRLKDLAGSGRKICVLCRQSGAIIYRKSVFDALGRFDKAYSTEADIAFSLKLLSRFSVFYSPELLFAYRVHPFQSFDIGKKIKTDEKDLPRYRSIWRFLRNSTGRCRPGNIKPVVL